MLPILRTVSVGGVFLAITILGLALIPPGRPHMQFASDETAARGPLIDRRMHPEWRQFLMLSAVRRANEVERLNDLPSTPAEPAPTALQEEVVESKVAGLPALREDADPEDQTGSINVAPSATMPIDIGATSSAELPIGAADEAPPVITLPVVNTEPAAADVEPPSPAVAHSIAAGPPLSKVVVQSMAEQPKPVVVIRKRPARKVPAKPAAAPAPAQTQAAAPPPFSFFQALFASFSPKTEATAAQPVKRTTLRRPRIKTKQTAAIR